MRWVLFTPYWLLLPLCRGQSSYDTENGVQSSPYLSQARNTPKQGCPFCMSAQTRTNVLPYIFLIPVCECFLPVTSSRDETGVVTNKIIWWAKKDTVKVRVAEITGH